MAGTAKAEQAPFCPIPTPRTISQGIKTGRYALTSLGLERLCSTCGEFWPADTEFFWATPRASGLHCWCKACYIAWKKPTKQAA